MNLAIDVHYREDSAMVAGIFFEDWSSNKIARTLTVEVDNVKPYEPGAFYKRELPCILELLKQVSEQLALIIVDGFVTLGDGQADGLGMHLYRTLDKSTPIIGVAKRPFLETPKDCEIYRGGSSKPLLVSSIGIPLSEAKTLIENMHGLHRIPTLLKRADQACRGICN